MEALSRWDHELIFSLVEPGTSVLDLGCGGGELLACLVEAKQVRGQAVEADPSCVAAAVRKGVPVYQKDLDLGLPEFKDRSFDCVILEKTLQTLHRPLLVLEEILRIGSLSMVSFPNFNYKGVVDRLLRTGRMPVTDALPYQWYATPNIHLFTLMDFLDWVEARGVKIAAGYAAESGTTRLLNWPADSSNAEELLFVLEGNSPGRGQVKK